MLTVKNVNNQSVDELENKMYYIDTMEYYSEIKRNKILKQATIGINLKKNNNIMLHERSQKQKTTYCYYSFYKRRPETVNL